MGGFIVALSNLVFIIFTVICALLWIFSSIFMSQDTRKILFMMGLLIVIYSYHLLFTPSNAEVLTSVYLTVILALITLNRKVITLVLISNLLMLFSYIELSRLEIGYHFLIFLIISLAGFKLIKRYKNQNDEIRNLNLMLSNQVKELKVLRNVSTLLQGTLELGKVLHIILSAVTAGYGLEFNRAMLFLVKDGKLQGEMAMGPLNKEEGLQIWQHVAQDKLNLDDMIEICDEVDNLDEDLNDIISNMSFSLEQENIITRVINTQESQLVEEFDSEDSFQKKLANKIEVEEFAIVPLVVKGKTIGVLCVDNIANGEKITYNDIDALLPFVNQAALAIESTRLYKLKERMAIRDNLTDLYNQRYFEQSLNEEVEKAVTDGNALGLLIADIDYFKAYNDQNGHPAGNTALAKLAEILQDSFREDDIVCRFGGEEFAIILPNINLEQLDKAAERVRKNVEETYFANQEKQPHNNFTISIGGSLLPNDTKQEDELLSFADTALYYAKEKDRNNVKLYHEYLAEQEEGECSE